MRAPSSCPPRRAPLAVPVLAGAVSRVALVWLVGCGLVGCGPPFVVTDSFTPPPTGAFAQKQDSLHDYVVGTELRLDIRAARAFVNLDAVEVVSKSPELVQVLAQERVEDEIQVRLKALAPGTVGINFLDERQRPMEERVLEVKLPDEIALAVNVEAERVYTTPVINGENLLLAAGGAVTWRVTYKHAGKEVKGTGVLQGNATTLTVENPTRGEPDREFLTLRAPAEATEKTPVELLVDDVVIRTLQVRNAPVDEIAAIQLDEGQLPSWRQNGDVSQVWAKAFTADATSVWGAPFAWTIESDSLEGSGDLVEYNYEGGSRRRIQVRAGEVVKDLTIEARDGTVRVTSTESPGCAAAAPSLPLALLALFVRRRRASTNS
jgi:hypothetical protein